MGRALTYEQGRLCIGRVVRLRRTDTKSGPIPATLVEAHPRYAVVRAAHSKETYRAAWEAVEDWQSHNGGPPPAPPPPATRAATKLAASIVPAPQNKETSMPTLPAVNSPQYAKASLEAAIAEADHVNLGEQIRTATGDVRAAKQMVEEAKAELTKAQARLSVLRDRAQKMLSEINEALA